MVEVNALERAFEVSYVITVEFILMPGAMTKFRSLIDENAQNSIDLEPGCQRFDVLVPQTSDDRIFLYEIYDDKLAFDAHLKSAHFLSFNEKSASLVMSRNITSFELAYEAIKQG